MVGCSSSPALITLPLGHSKTVHGVIEDAPAGPGLRLPCIHSGSVDGPKRCGPLAYPQGTPRCVLRGRSPATVDATLVRQKDGSYYWLVTRIGGQAC